MQQAVLKIFFIQLNGMSKQLTPISKLELLEGVLIDSRSLEMMMTMAQVGKGKLKKDLKLVSK